ncbi:MAG: RNA-binding protein [Coriobacteriia bacterium]|nr:RNA-binding protein [Coriobacteriia bacterium]
MSKHRVLIVDGYNVIRQTPPYSVLAEQDLDTARAALVSDVSAYAAQGAWRATVVFDAHANPRSDGVSHRLAGLTVTFSRYGIDADSVIESLARAARERGDETVVVTSDAQMQWTVLGGSVGRMSSAEFADSLRDSSGWWREHSPAGSVRGRLEDRIDEATRRRLAKWARS